MNSSQAAYRAYYHIRDRVLNKNDSGYSNYGGRGIRLLFRSFDEFYAEVGPRPSKEYSIDRINVNGNYEPGNVRWATRRQQNLNQRKRVDNTSGYRGVTKYLGTSPNKWMAYIRCNGKRMHIGNFKTAEEAAYVRDQFALELYGDSYDFNLINN